MRTILLAALVLSTATAAPEVYRCPQTYPGKDASATPLTGGAMMWGERNGNGWLVPRDEAAEEGTDSHYSFVGDEQAWLVCSYGSRKRIKGRFHDGHEWGQQMEGGGSQWWMTLAPKVGECTVQIREVKARSQSTWTVAANCEPPSAR